MLTRIIDDYAAGVELTTSTAEDGEPQPRAHSAVRRTGWNRDGWTRSGWTGRITPPLRTLPPRGKTA